MKIPWRLRYSVVVGFLVGLSACGTPAADGAASDGLPVVDSGVTVVADTTEASPSTVSPTTTVGPTSTEATATTAASTTSLATTTATTTSATVTSVVVSALRRDADGNDNLAENKNDEWVEITNQGPGSTDLTGWSIEDEGANHRFVFPVGFTLAEGAAVKVRSGCGKDTATDLYWCNSGSAVWNNDGDTAYLFDPVGELVDTS